MHLDDGRIERESFDLDAHNLLQLQLLEHPIQNTALGPAIHAHIDAMPVTEVLGKPAPLATMLGNIQKRVQHGQVRQAYIAPLNRQTILNPLVLFAVISIYSNIRELDVISVNTP
jgi:hypothetical protein